MFYFMSSENNKRIAKNTLLLYFRMILTMLVSLYTSRVILNALGITDYGIYNVVGGVVAMFSLLSGSLSSAVTRFLTFELGKNDLKQLKKVFSISITIHIALAAIILIVAECVGVWFLNNKMNIPKERILAANWVLQFSILTFIIKIISVPYNASIIAHEHMKAFAYVSIIEVSFKLLVAFLVVWLPFDKLIIYAFMLAIVALLIRLIYGIYCKRQFEECSYHFTYDKNLIKKMTGFAGWNFIGASSSILRNQGVNILLNLFCGPAVNAARGITMQVNSAINNFATNFMMAINPQIIKSYASREHHYMMTLIFQGARLSFYLLFFLSLPVLIETEQILTLWLKQVPEHTINFVRLILIFTLIESLSGTMITAMSATGKIRNYQLVVGGLQTLNFPISYIFLKIGFNPEITYLIAISISVCCFISRLWMLRGMIQLSIKNYIKNVLSNVMIVSFLSLLAPALLYYILTPGIFRLLLVSFIAAISTLSVMYFIGCSAHERNFINSKVSYVKEKIILTKFHPLIKRNYND